MKYLLRAFAFGLLLLGSALGTPAMGWRLPVGLWLMLAGFEVLQYLKTTYEHDDR